MSEQLDAGDAECDIVELDLNIYVALAEIGIDPAILGDLIAKPTTLPTNNPQTELDETNLKLD